MTKKLIQQALKFFSKIMDKMEKEERLKHIATFVMPTDFSFDLDGSNPYQALATFFIAQMYNSDLSVMEQVTPPAG